MEKELIKTDNYLFVVDPKAQVKENEVCLFRAETDYLVKASLSPAEIEEGLTIKDLHWKIIAHLPLNDSPALEGVPLLPAIEIGNDFNPINEYDKEYLSSLTFDGKSFVSDVLLATRLGYNRAREKYKFTEEDMINFACKVYNENYHKDASFLTTAETLIKSFSQPKSPTHFEFEMEDGFSKNNDEYIDELGAKGNYYTHLKVIKTTTNSQGQQVACGKYIY